MSAPYSRLLTGWHRSNQAGHSLTLSQFLVLCDVLQHPGEVTSIRHRAARLHLSHETTCKAQRLLADLGLATLHEIPCPGDPRSHHRSYPALTAKPTLAAYQLFDLHGPYKPRTRPQSNLNH